MSSHGILHILRPVPFSTAQQHHTARELLLYSLAPVVQCCAVDLVSKSCALQFDLGGSTVTLGGVAKGSGMIHPNMATMLALLTCDADVEPQLWTAMLKRAVKKSFNAVRPRFPP